MCKLPNETVVLCKQANEIVVCQLPVSFCLGFMLQPFFWSFWTQPPVTPSAALLKPLNNHYGEFWKADVSALPFGCTEKLLIQCQKQSEITFDLLFFTLLCDWSRKLAWSSSPIRCGTETNLHLIAWIFQLKAVWLFLL